jgi:hypothetical protein
LISLKTSPGAAKTFNNLPANDIVDAGGSTDCGSGVGGMGSIFKRVYPILRQKPAKVTRKVGDFFKLPVEGATPKP